MDLKTAFETNNIPCVVEHGVSLISPHHLYFRRLGIEQYLALGIEHLAKNKKTPEDIESYAAETKSWLEHFLAYKNQCEDLFDSDDWNAGLRIIAARNFLKHYSVDDKGNEATFAFARRSPTMRHFTPQEIQTFINYSSLMADPEQFHDPKISQLARVLYYTNFCSAISAMLKRIPATDVIPNEERFLLQDTQNTLEFLHDGSNLPPSRKEQEMAIKIRHFLDLQPLTSRVVFLSDFRLGLHNSP